jgi:hypothetical protein
MRIPRFRLLAALGVLTLTLAACGGSDKTVDGADPGDEVESTDTTEDDTETTEDDTETTEDDTYKTEDETGDLSPFAREFAEGFSQGAGFELPDDEIQCLANAVLDEFSFQELTSFQSEADVTADPEIVARLGALFDDCVSADTMVTILVDQGIPQATAECVSEQISFSQLIDAGLNPDSPETDALGDVVLDCV